MNLCAGVGGLGGTEGCGVITGKKTERGERRKCDGDESEEGEKKTLEDPAH